MSIDTLVYDHVARRWDNHFKHKQRIPLVQHSTVLLESSIVVVMSIMSQGALGALSFIDVVQQGSGSPLKWSIVKCTPDGFTPVSDFKEFSSFVSGMHIGVVALSFSRTKPLDEVPPHHESKWMQELSNSATVSRIKVVRVIPIVCAALGTQGFHDCGV